MKRGWRRRKPPFQGEDGRQCFEMHKAPERASRQQRSEEIGSEAAVMKKVGKEAVTLQGRKKQDNSKGQRLIQLGGGCNDRIWGREETNYQEKIANGCSRQRIKEEAEENGGAQVNECEKSHYAFVPIKLCSVPP